MACRYALVPAPARLTWANLRHAEESSPPFPSMCLGSHCLPGSKLMLYMIVVSSSSQHGGITWSLRAGRPARACSLDCEARGQVKRFAPKSFRASGLGSRFWGLVFRL